MLNEIFNVKQYNKGDLIERYSHYLTQIFQKGWDSHTTKRY